MATGGRGGPNLIPETTSLHSASIKGHAGFLGNEAANYFSKWAAHALSLHRNNTFPPSWAQSPSINARRSPPPPRPPPNLSFPDMTTVISTSPSVPTSTPTPVFFHFHFQVGIWQPMSLIGTCCPMSGRTARRCIHWTQSRLLPSAQIWTAYVRRCSKLGLPPSMSWLLFGGENRM